MPQKYPRTKSGMKKRRYNADISLNSPFNPHNGEPHTAKFIAQRRDLMKLLKSLNKEQY